MATSRSCSFCQGITRSGAFKILERRFILRQTFETAESWLVAGPRVVSGPIDSVESLARFVRVFKATHFEMPSAQRASLRKAVLLSLMTLPDRWNEIRPISQRNVFCKARHRPHGVIKS